MKKILMGTSALALAGTIAGAGNAEAATWEMNIGGFYEASVAYRSTDPDSTTAGASGDGLTDDEAGVDVLTDSEIIFRPSIVLDNGLTFGARVDLETDATVNENVDETYAYVSGSFGEIRLGHTDDAAAAMQGSAPDVSWIGASSGSLAGRLDIPEFAGTFVQAGAGDANKIIYFTPRFSGFQVAVSYAHDSNGNKNSPTGDFENLYAIGANYVNTFGAFDVALRGSYTTASEIGTNADDTHYAAHLTLGYAGFSIGGSYANRDNESLAAGNRAREYDFYDLGVAYNTGPWGVSFQYSHGDSDSANDSTDQYLAAIDYDLGPGVRVGAYAGYAENDTAGTDLDGFLIGTGFRLDF